MDKYRNTGIVKLFSDSVLAKRVIILCMWFDQSMGSMWKPSACLVMCQNKRSVHIVIGILLSSTTYTR